MNRKPFIAGNWKMNLTRASWRPLVRALADLAPSRPDVEIAVFPPFLYIGEVCEAAEGRIAVGAQDLYFEASGAFTGQVSAEQIRDAGATYVIIGHSERRHIFGESDAETNRKMNAALSAGLKPVLCVGETLEEREADRTADVVRRQLSEGLRDLDTGKLEELVVAYEPVWAIGTGVTATTEQAGEMHAEIRQLLGTLLNPDLAGRVRILYGGSVKPGNVDALMAVPDIDGVLVGGASLKAESFTRIADFKTPE